MGNKASPILLDMDKQSEVASEMGGDAFSETGGDDDAKLREGLNTM